MMKTAAFALLGCIIGTNGQTTTTEAGDTDFSENFDTCNNIEMVMASGSTLNARIAYPIGQCMSDDGETSYKYTCADTTVNTATRTNYTDATCTTAHSADPETFADAAVVDGTTFNVVCDAGNCDSSEYLGAKGYSYATVSDCSGTATLKSTSAYLMDYCIYMGSGSVKATCSGSTIEVKEYDTDDCTGTAEDIELEECEDDGSKSTITNDPCDSSDASSLFKNMSILLIGIVALITLY